MAATKGRRKTNVGYCGPYTFSLFGSFVFNKQREKSMIVKNGHPY